MVQAVFYCVIAVTNSFGKSSFQRRESGIMVLQKMNEIKQVSVVECAVFEAQ